MDGYLSEQRLLSKIRGSVDTKLENYRLQITVL